MSSKSSYTLWSPSDTVKDAAEVLGLSDLPDDVAKTLAMDVEYRIHEVVESALKFMRHSKRTTLTTRDISAAFKVLNIEPFHGYESGRPITFRNAVLGPNQTLFYIDEKEDVDFEKLINEPIPKVPREPTFTAHWLAIEGVQPAIMQNPIQSETKTLPSYSNNNQKGHSATALTQNVEVKPLVKHMISKELQLYFDRIIEALMSGVTSRVDTALYSVRSDPGLHQLTPYIIQFSQEKVSLHLQDNLQVIRTILDVVYALLQNPAIFIEPYIHQIVPMAVTVLISQKLGTADDEESYALRAHAGSLLSQISDRFGSSHVSLRPRLTRTFLKGFLDTGRSLASYHGIINGITMLGPEVVRIIIVGNLKVWFDPVFQRLDQISDKIVADKLAEALIGAFKTLPHSDVHSDSAHANLAQIVGDSAARFLIENGLSNVILLDV